MNEKRLRIYLEDHLALMVGEVELIGRCRRNNRSTPLREFLQKLENEVNAQTSIANDVIHRIGGKTTIEGRLKQRAAWFVEKLGRFKLNDVVLIPIDIERSFVLGVGQDFVDHHGLRREAPAVQHADEQNPAAQQ